MKTQPKVKWALKNVPFTRDSDIELIIQVWEQEGLILSHHQQNILRTKCSKPETIRRLRQKFQERGLYPASDRVERARFEKFRQAKDSIGVTNPVETDEVLNKAVHVKLEF